MKWLGVIFLLALIFQTSTIPVSTENETNPTTTPLDEHDVELTSKLPKLTDLIAKHNKSKTAKIRHWPLNLEGFVVIPIEFDATSGYYPKEIKWMRTQLEQIENKTCVKFVPHNTERDYIVIGNYSGCSSLLGRRGGRQKISMSYNRIKKTTCLRGTTMVHEMMHAFGIHHMHNSFDRDNYISVRLENVRPSSHKNFMIVNDSKFLDSPYDLRSATHYGRGSYSNNGNDVIVPHDPSFSLIIGHAKELSAGDITRINRLHSCPSLER